jgi:hypothetical protein
VHKLNIEAAARKKKIRDLEEFKRLYSKPVLKSEEDEDAGDRHN